MNDKPLSQEEINELLKGLQDGEAPEEAGQQEVHEGESQPEETQTEPPDINEFLTPMEQDTIGEIGNISFGSSATALSALLNQKVEITTPVVSAVSSDMLRQLFPRPNVIVHVKYTEGFEGSNLFVITTDDAAIIADLMLGGNGENPDPELSEMHLSAVQEAMNQMMGSASTSMSTLFNRRVDISPPKVEVIEFDEQSRTEYVPDGEDLIAISFSLRVGDLIDSKLMQLISVPFSKDYANALLGGGATEEAPVQEAQPLPKPAPSIGGHGDGTSAGRVNQHIGQRVKDAEQVVEKAVFSNFETTKPDEAEMQNLDMLLDIPLEVKVELGRTKKTIREILSIAQGSIIELDKLAGEPVDVLINDKLIAKGEVVVIDENFGVRITDIVSKKDRLTHLR
ncbi:flagellar motor switch phosphatase FliY [Shouchella clausii]|uniref:flagellar motor switch phosphatase FliY n=1 Tax=Shouchella clausii TaxID=79880 RepID=UPI000BA7B361|nr:flagellar motor switch phosphatase FliY [Shouchella clausii]PAD93846.1 flagellar motor switch phosphatase FliY [Shouchella clausii]